MRHCDQCGREATRLVGFVVGVDAEEHPRLLALVNCPCDRTLTDPVDRAAVETAAKTGSGRVKSSALDVLEDLDMHGGL